MAIEATGLNDAMELVRSYSQSLRTLAPLIQQIEEALEEIAEVAVTTQTSAVDGRPYAPLTETSQRLLGKPSTPALMGARLGASRLVKIDRLGTKDAILSTTLPYTQVHQFGNPNNTLYGNHAPIPARPILPLKSNGELTEEFQHRLEEISLEWLESRTRRRGTRTNSRRR